MDFFFLDQVFRLGLGWFRGSYRFACIVVCWEAELERKF
jgi:hypothetical protein